MPDVQIRRASDIDVPAIARIVYDSFAEFIPLLGRAPAPMFDDYAVAAAQGLAWVLVEGNEVTGIAVLDAGADHLSVRVLAVAPSRQGGGRGRRLVEFVEQEARRRRLAEVRLRAHVIMTRGLRFYHALGYEEYRRSERDGYVRVSLRKRLSPA